MIVYPVFCNDNGGKFLEQIFEKSKDAQHYIEAQPSKYQHMYRLETWETV